MADTPDEKVHSPGKFGTIGTHPGRITQPLLLAPTTEHVPNTLELDLTAIACISLHDIVFDFDSSFPKPDVALMLKEVPVLRAQQRSASGLLPPISIFGHADPVGDDAYNKAISGRRARAIYGLLTHDVAIWERLYKEEWSNKPVLRSMGLETGLPSTTARSQLMQKYMTRLFPQKLEKSDFLGRGADPDGRADFQGCSEFNPLVLLSQDEDKKLAREMRNAENRPNRRVLLFFFRPGLHVNPGRWPCPAATDPSVAACKTRFFGPPKKGDDRRAAGPARRTFAESRDTFACRFYSRVSEFSPCETPGTGLTTITIRLFNVSHEPMAGLKYTLEVGGLTFKAETNADGILSHQVPLGMTTGRLILDMWETDLEIMPIGPPDHPEGLQARLQNLGFFDEEPGPGGEQDGVRGGGAPPDLSLMRFQSANELDADGQMNDATKKKLLEVYGS